MLIEFCVAFNWKSKFPNRKCFLLNKKKLSSPANLIRRLNFQYNYSEIRRSYPKKLQKCNQILLIFIDQKRKKLTKRVKNDILLTYEIKNIKSTRFIQGSCKNTFKPTIKHLAFLIKNTWSKNNKVKPGHVTISIVEKEC